MQKLLSEVQAVLCVWLRNWLRIGMRSIVSYPPHYVRPLFDVLGNHARGSELLYLFDQRVFLGALRNASDLNHSTREHRASAVTTCCETGLSFIKIVSQIFGHINVGRLRSWCGIDDVSIAADEYRPLTRVAHTNPPLLSGLIPQYGIRRPASKSIAVNEAPRTQVGVFVTMWTVD